MSDNRPASPYGMMSQNACAAVQMIQAILWRKTIQTETTPPYYAGVWDPDKEWDSDTVSEIAQVLIDEGLGPKETK